MKLVSVQEMVAIEQEANRSGISYNEMMKNAGDGLASRIHQKYASLDRIVMGLVGSGNNGGDTLVALAWLAKHGWKTTAYIVQIRPVEDPLVMTLKELGGVILLIDEDQGFLKLDLLINRSSILLDGILGTGIKLPLRPAIAGVLDHTRRQIKELNPAIKVVAVDCPSGTDCDSGEVAPEVIPADLTITMAAYKSGLLKFPAFKYAGEIELVGIGLPEEGSTLASWKCINRFVPDAGYIREHLPERPIEAHKGTFGTATIVAGCDNYPGAALLAGEAAYIIGSGLVTIGVPDTIYPSLVGHLAEATWLRLAHQDGSLAESAADELAGSLSRTTCLLVGPGLGSSQGSKKFINRLLTLTSSSEDASGENAEMIPSKGNRLPPLVLDADGLRLASQLDNWYNRLPTLSILTPHPGEMSVLTGVSKENIQNNRLDIAESYSKKWGHIVVLKGALTIISSPDGKSAVIPVATPALARAGSGDVLAGLIAGLRAQGVDAFQAAVSGAWIHAQAGLRAVDAVGNPASVLAGDIIIQSIEILTDLHAK